MKPTDFRKDRFILKILIDKPIKEVFELISSSKGLCSWFLGTVVYRDKDERMYSDAKPHARGDKYRWKWQKGHEVSGELLSFAAEDEMTVTFGPDFSVRFTTEKGSREGSTLVTITQLNHDPKESNEFGFLNCCVCWTFFLSNLKSVAEHGIDLRETAILEESFINQ